MAIIKRTLMAGTEPTAEQLMRLREAAKLPLTYDDDCPELTDEQLAQFHPVNGMTWEERTRLMREQEPADLVTVSHT